MPAQLFRQQWPRYRKERPSAASLCECSSWRAQRTSLSHTAKGQILLCVEWGAHVARVTKAGAQAGSFDFKSSCICLRSSTCVLLAKSLASSRPRSLTCLRAYSACMLRRTCSPVLHVGQEMVRFSCLAVVYIPAWLDKLAPNPSHRPPYADKQQEVPFRSCKSPTILAPACR